MHELSIAQSIISTVLHAIPTEKQSAVKSIFLQIGVLSGIETDALVFSFDLLKEKTNFTNAILNIEIIKAEGICICCNRAFTFSSYGTACPSCGSYDIQIIKGKEMRILSVEIE